MQPKDLPEKSNLSKFMHPKKLIHWDENGIPHPFTEWVLPKNQIDNVLMAALALPYEGYFNEKLQEIVFESEYKGLTNIEVACIKQAKSAAGGDLEALKFTIERILGKPKQAIEQTVLSISLKDYLETLNLEESAETIIDVTPSLNNITDEWDDIEV